MHVRFTLAAAALAAVALAAPAAAQMEHNFKPSPAFSQLTPLAGEWEGQNSAGKTVTASYQVVSGGTALLERLRTGDEPEMLTVYTPDGDHVAVTHFCSSGNQPQMRTVALGGDAKTFSFTFVRATNLPTPETGHMHHLTVTLQDKDHFTQEWTWQEKGTGHTAVFHFTRKA
jgi:hypothetical protein